MVNSVLTTFDVGLDTSTSRGKHLWLAEQVVRFPGIKKSDHFKGLSHWKRLSVIPKLLYITKLVYIIKFIPDFFRRFVV